MLQPIKNVLLRTPLFIPARAVYRRLFKREAIDERNKLVKFYSQFIPIKSLVFDVGANRGEYSEIFCHAGAAKVIAIEPNPDFVLRLQSLAKRFPIVTEFCAVGDALGTAELNICSDPGYSTMLPASRELFSDSPVKDELSWTKRVSVSVVTLDALAKKYGVPSYIKIDVEGYEPQVLGGMSFNPRCISFEFRTMQKPLAYSCINLLSSRGYEFSSFVARHTGFPSWISGGDAIKWLHEYNGSRGTYGDFYARLKNSGGI